MTWLDERRAETEALLRLRKARLSVAIADGEDENATSELAAITKLEIQLANLAQVSRLNDLTRGRGRGRRKARREGPQAEADRAEAP